MENIQSGKEKVMKTINEKRHLSPDMNNIRREETMYKTAKTGKGLYVLFAALAAVAFIAALGLIAQPMTAEAKGRFESEKGHDGILSSTGPDPTDAVGTGPANQGKARRGRPGTTPGRPIPKRQGSR